MSMKVVTMTAADNQHGNGSSTMVVLANVCHGN